MTWTRIFIEVFPVHKRHNPLKQKSLIIQHSLVKHLCYSIRNWGLHCNICLFQERSFLLLLLTSEKGLRDCESLVVKHMSTKEGLSLCVSEGVKDLWDSGTPKRVSWGLDVGNRLCRTSIKNVFALSLPLNSFIFCCLLFLFSMFNLSYYLRIQFKMNLGTWVKIKVEFLIGE